MLKTLKYPTTLSFQKCNLSALYIYFTDTFSRHAVCQSRLTRYDKGLNQAKIIKKIGDFILAS